MSLASRLREAGPEELAELVRDNLAELDVMAVRQALRNPFVDREIIEIFLGEGRLMQSHDVRRGIVVHPKTPEARALQLVQTLRTRELVELNRLVHVRPTVRRAAERRIADRLTALTVGEKTSLARVAGAGVIQLIRNDPSPRVMRSLLENPRLTEGLLMPLLASESSHPQVLKVVAENPRWGVRYPVRVALAQNPRTPAPTAVAILPMLKKHDLGAVSSNRRISAMVRRRADLLLGRLGG